MGWSVLVAKVAGSHALGREFIARDCGPRSFRVSVLDKIFARRLDRTAIGEYPVRVAEIILIRA
jgi:hypothetical protein